MKFVDEVVIDVIAGNGGNGCCSFLRLKFMPFGGPDGGDGGDGGSIFLETDSALNTLVDYRYVKTFQAQHGEKGHGKNCTGRAGEDLMLKVPIGTMVYDDSTNELIADLDHPDMTFCVAKGGRHGVGNARFKSSINRAPRKTIPGQPGERIQLRLELSLLADVGLVGLPNAGKSTLISALSSAKPKIADYPFTTLYPILGVVRPFPFRSFVLADLPGLIEGASDGAGLGVRFLKHIARTRLLLHTVDVSPTDGGDPVHHFQLISEELRKFSPDLLQKERWLVVNKIDLLPEDDRARICADLIQALQWEGRVFFVSGKAHIGLDQLAQEALLYLEQYQSDEG